MFQIAGLGFAMFDQAFAHPNTKIKKSAQGQANKVAMILQFICGLFFKYNDLEGIIIVKNGK